MGPCWYQACCVVGPGKNRSVKYLRARGYRRLFLAHFLTAPTRFTCMCVHVLYAVRYAPTDRGHDGIYGAQHSTLSRWLRAGLDCRCSSIACFGVTGQNEVKAQALTQRLAAFTCLTTPTRSPYTTTTSGGSFVALHASGRVPRFGTVSFLIT